MSQETGDKNASTKTEPKNSFQQITWSLKELDLNISVHWDSKTGQLFKELKKDHFVPSPIQQVATKDDKPLFCYTLKKTTRKQAEKKRKTDEYSLLEKSTAAPTETNLRKFTDERTRKITLVYNNHQAEYELTRETLAKTEARLYALELPSTTGKEMLSLIPKFSKGLHTTHRLQKTHYGKVDLEPEDIEAIRSSDSVLGSLTTSYVKAPEHKR